MIFVFLGWTAILAFAIFRSERRTTRLFLISVMLLNLVAAAAMIGNGDEKVFQAFERVWASHEPAYHAD